MSDILQQLGDILEERKGAEADSSYVASLYHKGLNKILEKVGEEATETIIEAMRGDPEALKGEAADLIYHLLVVLAAAGVRPEDVWQELERREHQSGLAEKASR